MRDDRVHVGRVNDARHDAERTARESGHGGECQHVVVPSRGREKGDILQPESTGADPI
jgi:hypothetical protein